MFEMSRNGRSRSSPSRTIRIRPDCSTTNMEVGSVGRQARSVGLSRPSTTGSIDSWGGSVAALVVPGLADGDGAVEDGVPDGDALSGGAGVTDPSLQAAMTRA